MKQLLIAFGVFVLCLVAISCSKNNKDVINEQNQESLQKGEVVSFKKFSKSVSTEFCDVNVSVDFPISGNRLLLDSIRGWINYVLSMGTFFMDREIPTYNGEKSDGQALVNYYTKQKIYNDFDDVDKKMLKQMKMKYELKENIEVVYQGKYLVSYLSDTYSFTGGTHGGTTLASATFNNQTGEMLGWEMIKDTAKLKDFIVDGLLQFFEIQNKKELENSNLHVSLDELPLPMVRPYFTNEGLALCYLQYEIASYADGMPSVLIPWDKCKDVLSDSVIQLIGNEMNR